MHFFPSISIAFIFVDAKNKIAEKNMKRIKMWVYEFNYIQKLGGKNIKI
jgi:hypothetical protein